MRADVEIQRPKKGRKELKMVREVAVEGIRNHDPSNGF